MTRQWPLHRYQRFLWQCLHLVELVQHGTTSLHLVELVQHGTTSLSLLLVELIKFSSFGLMNFILIFCKQMVSVVTSDIQLMKEWRWLLPQQSIKEATKAVLKELLRWAFSQFFGLFWSGPVKIRSSWSTADRAIPYALNLWWRV